MKTEKIQQKVDKICEGDFCDSDVGLLFLWLRSEFENDPVLLDLANFVAHGDERDRGISFTHVHSFVENFLEVSEKGGTIHGLQPVFQRDDVIERLMGTLKRLGIVFDENKFSAKKDAVIDNLMTLMEETNFQINDARVTRCYARRNGSKMMLSLQANLVGPFIQMTGNASVESNLFN